MSASDLAPFVAAIIDDGIAPELQRENEEQQRKINTLESKIQELNNERLLVQITGRHGRPIYGETSLKHGKSSSYPFADGPEMNLLLLQINNENDAICPFDEEPVTQLEIRVGGMLIMPRVLEQLVTILSFNDEEHDDEDDLDKLVYLNELELPTNAAFDDEDDCPIIQLIGRVGPITVRHYKSLCNLPEDAAIYISNLLEHNVLPTTGAATEAQQTRKMTLTVTKIVFYRKNISGCISLMKQLGIRTSAPRRS